MSDWNAEQYGKFERTLPSVDLVRAIGVEKVESAFEEDVLREVEQAYPVQKNGEIIFRFPRLFFVARKCAEKGKMIILPQKKSLDDLLEKITVENLHSEIPIGNAIGNEEW